MGCPLQNRAGLTDLRLNASALAMGSAVRIIVLLWTGRRSVSRSQNSAQIRLRTISLFAALATDVMPFIQNLARDCH